MAKDSRFTVHLKWAARIVAGWPAWKRNILGRTIMTDLNAEHGDFDLSDKAEAELTKGHNEDNFSKGKTFDEEFKSNDNCCGGEPVVVGLDVEFDAITMMAYASTAEMLAELCVRGNQKQCGKLKQLVQLYTQEELDVCRKTA